MILWKCYTQYATKFGKLSSGHRTGKGEFSFQSQRKAMPKKCSNYVSKLMFKVPQVGFNGMWSKKFRIYKLDLEKAEEPEIKLPTSIGSLKKGESCRKTPISALLTMPKPLTVCITTNYGKFLKRWEYHTTWPGLPPEKSVCRSRSNSWNWTRNYTLAPNWERSTSRLYIVTQFS